VETEYPNDAPRHAWLAGQKVCLIGRFLAMSQAGIAAAVLGHGGVVVRSPGRDTSLVVVGGDGWPCLRDGSPTHAARRVQRLQQAGAPVAVLSEECLLERLGLVEPTTSICRELTLADLTQVLGLPGPQIRRWVRLGLVTPKRTVHRLDFFDLAQVASAKRICELLAHGASLGGIRRGLEQMDRWLPQRDLPLSQLSLLEHDGRILVRLDGALAEPNGQLRFSFEPPGEPATVAPVRDDAESLFDAALAAEDAGDLTTAADRYGRAILLDADDPVLHFNLANCLFGLARFAEAAESYQRALELDAGYAEAWNNLGNAYARLNAWQQAIRAYRRALRLVPRYDDARHNLDRLLSRMSLPLTRG